MIRLDNVHKSYRTRIGRKIVLRDVSATFPQGRNIGILGVNGAGKSTLIRLLAGAEWPDSGTIERHGRVSFPLGFGGSFSPYVTGRENVTFIARVYGIDPKTVLAYVADFTELGDYMDMPVITYSAGMRAKLAFGVCLAIDFDIYLIDEITAVGDASFQVRCREAFEDRMKRADIIMVSHDFHTIRSYCDTGAILSAGELMIYDDLEDAIADYRAMLGLDRMTATATVLPKDANV
jgi:capsular polysaccharide transport system ATP-binding protein